MLVVTGSAGHLGEGMMRTLRAAGRPAIGVDVEPSPFTDRVGSILDPGFVADALRGARAVVHAATLHKPHVATHAQRAFLDTNVTGTLTLLEAALAAGVEAFVFTSTTSAFGAALTPAPGAPAAWIDEDVAPVPRNVYGTTKLAAEALCELFARRDRLPVVILRTSRFFPEPDDDPETAAAYPLANVQANELLYRRADLADVADAHLRAIDRAPALGFARLVVSAPTPFTRADLAELRRDAPAVVARRFPDQPALYAARGWRMFPSIDRVYDSRRAVEALGWRPRTGFADVLASLRAGEDFASPLARAVGSKGYHPRAEVNARLPDFR